MLVLVFGWMLVKCVPPWSIPPLAEDASRKAILNHRVGVGLWQAAAFGLGVIGILLATARWWMVPGDPGVGDWKSEARGRMFWRWVLPILVLATCLRWPLLDHSVYGDEHYSITKFIHGEHRLSKDGGEEFREVAWKQTVWGYQRPNNHIFFSIVARTTHSGWQKITGARPEVVEVLVLRLPALAAALLMALHLWHISQGAEVRGYGFVFLFLASTVNSAIWALRRGHWLSFCFPPRSEML